MSNTLKAKNPTWSRDELILALDLYVRFKGNPPGKNTKSIMELSDLLNDMGSQIANRKSDFRNPNGVYMKVMNFRRFDPVYVSQGKKGLQRGGKLEEKVWLDFVTNRPKLGDAASAIRLTVTRRKNPEAFKEDKSLLQSTARVLQKKLSKRLEGSSLHFSERIVVDKEPDVDGWYVRLASGAGLYLAIALDGFTSPDRKRFWFGFAADKSRILSRMKDSCPVRWRKIERHITSAMLSRGGPGKWRLTRALSNADVDRPIFESYRADDPPEFYWGIYAEKSEKMIPKALAFFADMIQIEEAVTSEIKIVSLKSGRSKGPPPSFGQRAFNIPPANIGYVYVMQFGAFPIWKIGRAKDINKRFRELNKHIPWKGLKWWWTPIFAARLKSEKDAHRVEQRILDQLGANMLQHEIVYCSKASLLEIWNKNVSKVICATITQPSSPRNPN